MRTSIHLIATDANVVEISLNSNRARIIIPKFDLLSRQQCEMFS
jgi:hypothetical protein